MNKLLFICCCLFMLALGMLLTTPVAAQDAPAEQDKERDWQVRVGLYFSGYVRTYPSSLYGSDGSIQSPEDDVMPYPVTSLSIRYNKYQATFGWGDDLFDRNNDGIDDEDEDEHNERIAKFTARYNYYPQKKTFYIFGGGVIWHFHKKFHLQKRTCTDYGPYGTDCVGERIFTDIKTDRPDGKSTTLGVILGFGVEYKWRHIVFSHEIEFYRSDCEYKDFICKGTDFRFLGLHIEF